MPFMLTSRPSSSSLGCVSPQNILLDNCRVTPDLEKLTVGLVNEKLSSLSVKTITPNEQAQVCVCGKGRERKGGDKA